MSSQKSALKEAVTEILSCALQADSDIQRLAEERKKALEIIDEYPFILIEILQNNEEAFAEKHMASVFLKNYLYDFCFRKVAVRKKSELLGKLSLSLVQVLTQEYIHIKTMICNSLSFLVYKGFWPCIDSKIMSMLQSDTEIEVFAAVLFLKHLLDPHQYLNIPIPAEYFEVLLNIYKRNYSSEVSRDTISSMSFIINYSMEDQPSLQRDAASRISRQFKQTLEEPYSLTNDFQLKSEVIKGIMAAFSLDPDVGSEIITPNLPAVGQLMTNCCHEYKKIVINSSFIPRDAHESDDPNNFNELINNILDLVNGLINTPFYAELLMNGLDNLLYCLFVFMCCYDRMEVSIFLEEDEKSMIFPIRNNAVDTLMNILLSLQEEKTKNFFHSLHNVFHKHITECTLDRSNSELYYIRITESLMYGLGMLREYFPSNMIFLKNQIFPHSYYLESWSEMFRTETNVLLTGRLYWLASRYSATLAPNTLDTHLKALMAHLQGNCKIMYIPCLEAIRNHLAAFEFSKPENRIVISNYANELVVTLIRVYHNKLSSKPKLYLNAMANLIKYHEEIAKGYVLNVQEIVIQTIISYFSDGYVLRETSFLLSSLALHASCKESLQHTIVPFLLKLIYNDLPESLRGRKDAPEKGLEFLNTLIIYTPEPINDYLLVESFHSAYNCVIKNEENDINLTEVAVNFISTTMVKLLPQIKNLRDNKGKSLTDYILNIIYELLDPSKSIWTNKIGRFCIISLMSLTEQLEANIEGILKSLLSSFQVIKVDPSEKKKALMLIFAYMFMCLPEITTNFLSSIPGPTGGSALSFLFNAWRKDYVTQIGKFEKTIISMALTQIIRYAIDSNNERISELTVTLKNSDKSLNGIEYMYYLLVHVLLSETGEKDQSHGDVNKYPLILQLNSEYCDEQKQQEEEFLFKFHLCSNIDITTHIKTFLNNYTTHYFNVVRQALRVEEIERLQALEAIPDLSME